MCKEIWKSIVGFEGLYEVSDRGRVKRIKGFRARKDRILKSYTNHRGYLLIGLYKNNCVMGKQIHRLILEAFIESCPDGKECNHKDGDKTNNKLENLEWVTHSENERHKYDTLKYTAPRGERRWNCKLSDKEIIIIRKLCQRGYNQQRIAEWFGISSAYVCAINNGRSRKYIREYISKKMEYGNSKLIKQQVVEIRGLYNNEQYTYKKLGELFSVCRKTIWNIINNKTWRNV